VPRTRTKPAPPRALAPLPPGVTPLLARDQVRAALGGISERMLDEMIAKEEFPPATCRLGKLPRWHQEVVNAWIDRRCGRDPIT
jgi:predicted DNA-binding transcriptional regulator AlpA